MSCCALLRSQYGSFILSVLVLCILSSAIAASAQSTEAPTRHPELVPQTQVGSSTSMAFSSDGLLLAVGNQVWDMRSRKLVRTLPARTAVDQVALSPEGKLLAGITNGDVVIWDVRNGSLTRKLHLDGRQPTCLVFLPHTSLLAVGYRGGIIEIWDAPSAQPRRRLETGLSDLAEITVDAAGRSLAALGAGMPRRA